jgi:chemotaxis protein MotB
LEQALAPEIAGGEVEVRSGRDGLVISLREAGFFDSGSAGVKVGSQQAFSRMAMLLGERQYNIRIEGHTDNVRIHNTQFTSNWELSTARATEMIRLLIMKYGFSPQRRSAGGYGEYHPIASNNTESRRALNRWVDVVVVGKHEAESAATDPPASGTKQQRPFAHTKPNPLQNHKRRLVRLYLLCPVARELAALFGSETGLRTVSANRTFHLPGGLVW